MGVVLSILFSYVEIMKFKYLCSILNQTPDVLESQLAELNPELLHLNEGGKTWTVSETLCHLIHCEVDDWVPRMNSILKDSADKKFRPFDRTFGFEMAREKPISQLLDQFRELRVKNLDYLSSLEIDEVKLNMTGIHTEFGNVTLRQLLSTWAVHDLSHIAQINRIIAKQFKSDVGPWVAYLPILER